MSSLLQFRGDITRKGVVLEALLNNEKSILEAGYLGCYEDVHTCTVCNKQHPRIYTFVRKPRGMFGCWVIFHWNNEDHVPDLSCPINLKLKDRPKDLKRLSDEESSELWHRG